MRSLVPYAGQDDAPRPAPPSPGAILRFFRDGKRTDQIARRFHIAEATVLRDLNRARDSERVLKGSTS